MFLTKFQIPKKKRKKETSKQARPWILLGPSTETVGLLWTSTGTGGTIRDVHRDSREVRDVHRDRGDY